MTNDYLDVLIRFQTMAVVALFVQKGNVEEIHCCRFFGGSLSPPPCSLEGNKRCQVDYYENSTVFQLLFSFL